MGERTGRKSKGMWYRIFYHSCSLEPKIKKEKNILLCQLKESLTKAIAYTTNSVLNIGLIFFWHEKFKHKQQLAMIQWLKDVRAVIMIPLAFPS